MNGIKHGESDNCVLQQNHKKKTNMQTTTTNNSNKYIYYIYQNIISIKESKKSTERVCETED